jgi:hypothetical protein
MPHLYVIPYTSDLQILKASLIKELRNLSSLLGTLVKLNIFGNLCEVQIFLLAM